MADWELFRKQTGRTGKRVLGISIVKAHTLTIPRELLQEVGIGDTCSLYIGVGDCDGMLAVSAGNDRKINTNAKRKHLRVAVLLERLGYGPDNLPARKPHYEIKDGMLIIDPRREYGREPGGEQA